LQPQKAAEPAPGAPQPSGDVAALEAKIAAQGEKVKSMKDSGADAAAVKAEVELLLGLKTQLPDDHPQKPQDKKKKKKKK